MRRTDLHLRSHLPEAGKGSCLDPADNTEAMNLHLAEIANAITPGYHAVLRSSRMASVGNISGSRQYHHYPAAAD
jgi:hypothetical protein